MFSPVIRVHAPHKKITTAAMSPQHGCVQVVQETSKVAEWIVSCITGSNECGVLPQTCSSTAAPKTPTWWKQSS